ncbi:tripartite tricarboxylate transporter substrate binding protein [Bordetella bronchialis]|uniref:tripartite tricarboxylate transporter substrate binding protein n=1 Tax=Bordetella bronchialis TaxID=463025 RepID=UPI003CFFADAA
MRLLYRLMPAAVMLLAMTSARATDSVRLIIPTTAGGGTDGFFRILAKESEPYLGKPITVINMCSTTGCAGGTIGVSRLVQSEPDGNTLAGVWMGPLTVAPHTLPVAYLPSDYVPVMRLTSAPYAVCTKADFPADTGEQMIELLRMNRDAYTYGTDGVGNSAHIAMARIYKRLDTRQRDVPFKGAGETLAAMLGGHIDIYVGSLPPVMEHVRTGRAKCQFVTSADKVAQLPGAAGLRDLGLADEETLLWRGIIAPKGTPVERLRELEAGFEAAAGSPAVRAYVEGAGEQIVVYKGTEFRQRIDAEYEQFGRLVSALRQQLDVDPH